MSAKKIPKYKMIEQYILQKIKSGEYQQGKPIETEKELIKHFDVSRVTVRQATNNLVAKGYLSRNQGSGTFVTHQKLIERSTNVKSFTEEMKDSGKEVTTDILEFKVISAPEDIATRLEIKNGKAIYYLKRLRKANNVPMMLETTYMAVDKYPNLTYEAIQQSKYTFVEETTGESIDHSHHIVVPIMPTEEIVQHFKCEETTPILKVLNSTFLSSGEPMDYTELILNTDEYQYQSVRAKNI